MVGRNMFWFALAFAAVSATANPADSISERAANIEARLEVLNNIGIECEAHLQVSGMEGAAATECEKYLRNMQGAYFSAIGSECTSLLDWYEDKRKMIVANPDYADENPTEAAALVRDMRSAQSACDFESFASVYPYLLKPIRTIQALSELE